MTITFAWITWLAISIILFALLFGALEADAKRPAKIIGAILAVWLIPVALRAFLMVLAS